MKILIIEDEMLAVKRLRKVIESIDPEVEVVGVTNSICSSVEWLNNFPAPDLIMMDIELADGQSFEIFKRTRVQSPVIFVTSYDEFAIQAFKVNSVDYLMKPVDREDMEASLQKFRQIKKMYAAQANSVVNVEKLVEALQERIQPKAFRKRFLIKQGQKMATIEIDEIAYFFVDGRLTFFKTFDNRKLIVDYTMDELETMLDPADFFRINRSCYVSMKAIQEVQDYFGNRYMLSMKPAADEEAIVSRDRVADFKQWLGK